MSDAREILTPAPADLLTSELEVVEVEDCLRPVEADLCTAWDLQQEGGDLSFKRRFTMTEKAPTSIFV